MCVCGSKRKREARVSEVVFDLGGEGLGERECVCGLGGGKRELLVCVGVCVCVCV